MVLPGFGSCHRTRSPVAAGESFQAAYIIGYFDSIEDMQKTYDKYKGATAIEVTKEVWKLIK